MNKDNIKVTEIDNPVSADELKEKVKAGFIYLKINIRTIIMVCIIGGSIGLLYSFFSKASYIATSTFVLEEKNGGGMSSYAGLASQFGLSVGVDGSNGLFEGDNIIELYKSRSMLQKTLLTKIIFDGKQQLLIDRFIQAENLREAWKNNPQLSNINFDNLKNHSIKQDSIISVVVKLINKKYLTVFKPDKKLSIINVTVTHHDELFAQNFNETLVENVNDFYVNTKIKKSVKNIQILKFQSDSIRRLLDNSLSGVASSEDAYPNANPFNQGLKVPSQKRQIDVQTNAALYAEMVKNLALAQISMRQETPLIQIIDAPVLPLDADKMGAIKGTVIGLVFGFFLSSGYFVMKKNYIYNIILTLTNILFPIITFPYVSRLIGPLGIGKIQFIISFSQYFALFAGLGIPLYGIREIAKYKNDKEKLATAFSELIIIYLITSVAVSFIYFLIIFNFSYFAADRNLYILSLSLILFGFSSIDWFYSGLEQFRLISLRSMIVKIISVIAVFVFIKTATDYKAFLYISIFSILGNNLINLLFIRQRLIIKATSLNFKRHFKPLTYIFSTTLATSMYTVLDTVLLGFLSNAKAVGFYTAAIKLTKISLPFITSVGAVTLPTLSKNFHDNNSTELKSLLQRSFDFIVFFSIPITVGSCLFAKEFVVIFSGKGFIDAVIPMQIMSILPVLIGLGFFFGFQVLVPAGKDRELFLSVIFGMVAGVTLNFLLVPGFAQTGGAIANVLTELLVTFSYYFFFFFQSLFSPRMNVFFQSILASLMFIPIYFLASYLKVNLLPGLVLATVACGLLYAFMQSVIFKNHMLMQIINKLKFKLSPK